MSIGQGPLGEKKESLPQWRCADLLAVVSDGGQDGAKGFDTHGNVQEVSSEEEVVVVPQQRHEHVPDQVEESLKDKGGLSA